jgi:hypothetical protein
MNKLLHSFASFTILTSSFFISPSAFAQNSTASTGDQASLAAGTSGQQVLTISGTWNGSSDDLFSLIEKDGGNRSGVGPFGDSYTLQNLTSEIVSFQDGERGPSHTGFYTTINFDLTESSITIAATEVTLQGAIAFELGNDLKQDSNSTASIVGEGETLSVLGHLSCAGTSVTQATCWIELAPASL